jgi:hypothetical protein
MRYCTISKEMVSYFGTLCQFEARAPEFDAVSRIQYRVHCAVQSTAAGGQGLEPQMGRIQQAQNTMTTSLCWSYNTLSLTLINPHFLWIADNVETSWLLNFTCRFPTVISGFLGNPNRFPPIISVCISCFLLVECVALSGIQWWGRNLRCYWISATVSHCHTFHILGVAAETHQWWHDKGAALPATLFIASPVNFGDQQVEIGIRLVSTVATI